MQSAFKERDLKRTEIMKCNIYVKRFHKGSLKGNCFKARGNFEKSLIAHNNGFGELLFKIYNEL